MYRCPVHSGEWRNWQTRWLQVPVRETSWGFKSPLAHHESPAQSVWEVAQIGRLLPDFYPCARNDRLPKGHDHPNNKAYVVSQRPYAPRREIARHLRPTISPTYVTRVAVLRHR